MFIEEFSYAFNVKYIINRCAVISGPLQFGKQDQGFVSLWVWKHLMKKKLNYIGYNGLEIKLEMFCIYMIYVNSLTTNQKIKYINNTYLRLEDQEQYFT